VLIWVNLNAAPHFIGVGRELSHGGIDLGNPPMARRGSYLRSMICASFRGGTLYSEAPFGSLIGLIFEMRPKDSVGRHAHHCRSKTSRCARFTTTRGLMKKTLPRFPRLPTKKSAGTFETDPRPLHSDCWTIDARPNEDRKYQVSQLRCGRYVICIFIYE